MTEETKTIESAVQTPFKIGIKIITALPTEAIVAFHMVGDNLEKLMSKTMKFTYAEAAITKEKLKEIEDEAAKHAPKALKEIYDFIKNEIIDKNFFIHDDDQKAIDALKVAEPAPAQS